MSELDVTTGVNVDYSKAIFRYFLFQNLHFWFWRKRVVDSEKPIHSIQASGYTQGPSTTQFREGHFEKKSARG